MAPKIFWSWQSDKPDNCCREFVREALEAAAALAAKDAQLDERPEIDHDVKGESGLAEIAATVFRKIDAATLFVGDVTTITRKAKKAFPNSNVLIELGYAASALGWPNLILVANCAWGWRFDDLPFDLKHRSGTITYNLAETASAADAEAARARLIENLKDAILTGLRQRVSAVIPRDPIALSAEENSRRSSWGKPRTIKPERGFGGTYDVSVIDQPRLYATILPASAPRLTRVKALEMLRSANLWGLWTTSNGDHANTRQGVISFGFSERRKSELVLTGAAEWFSDRGELRLFLQIREGYISIEMAVQYWAAWLLDAGRFFATSGAKSPFRVELGVSGLDKVKMFISHHREATAIDKEMAVTREIGDFDPGSLLPILDSAEEILADAFALTATPGTASATLNALAKDRPRD
jgi:hypothetical protein